MIASLIICLFLLPALFVWLRERRLAKLAKAELRLARSVTQIEECLLNGQVTCGDDCHDLLFDVILIIQKRREYTLPWYVIRTLPGPEQERLSKLAIELKSGASDFSNAFNQFLEAYYECFRHRHPIQHKFYWLHTLFSTSAPQSHGLAKSLGVLSRDWSIFANHVRQQFFVQGGTYEKTQWAAR